MKEWRDAVAEFPYRIGDVARGRPWGSGGARRRPGKMGTIVETFREGSKGPWVAVVMYPDGTDDEWYAGDLEVISD